MSVPLRSMRQLLHDTTGAAAVEFVLWLTILVLPVLNAVDIGVYAFKRMQLDLSAQAAVQAAWHACDTTAKLPAVTNCTGLATIMTTAAQATSLGNQVTIVGGSPIEGYYCLDGSGVLQNFGATATIGGAPTKTAATCTGTTRAPSDYIQVTTSYAYTPVFTGVSAAALLPTPITRTAWMRLN